MFTFILLALASVSLAQQEPSIAPQEPEQPCQCILNFCKCCEKIHRSYPLIGDFDVDTCVGVALRLDQNRMAVTLTVNGHEIVGKNFTGTKPGAPLCAPFELGLSMCIEVTNPSVDIIHHLFKGCPVITGLYLDQQIFSAPLPCFSIPLSKGNTPYPPRPSPLPVDFVKRLAAFKEFIEAESQ